MRGIPVNACAYVATLDMLTKCEWVRPYPVDPSTAPGVVDCLLDAKGSDYGRAIQ